MNYLTTITNIITILFLAFQSIEVNGNALEVLSELSKLGEINASSYLKEVFENIKQEEAAKLDPKILDNKIEENYVKKDKTNITVVINPGFKIEGISQVLLRNFNSVLNFKNMRLDVGAEIFLPQLKGTGTYVMNGKAFKYFPIRGNGQVLIEISGISGNVSVEAFFNGYQFVAHAIDFKLSQSAIKLHFDNLIYANLSGFFNSLLNYLAKPLVDKLIINNERTMDNVKLKLLDAINKKLEKYDALTLLNAFNHIHN